MVAITDKTERRRNLFTEEEIEILASRVEDHIISHSDILAEKLCTKMQDKIADAVCERMLVKFDRSLGRSIRIWSIGGIGAFLLGIAAHVYIHGNFNL
jgi:hypothetical protein